MMFEELRLHNIGPYRGEHRINLATTPEKPVILIGALNGSGKTTLLESMYLALFGRAATGTSRGSSSYVGYLAQLINRDVDPKVGASVALRFRHRAHGEDEVFEVTRTWRPAGNTVKEHLEVVRNGGLDLEASERWLEHVEQFLPVQLADLFLFDGERIEGLADPERAKEFLRTGIHALLGLDLVDDLCRSLVILERKKLSKSADLSESEAAVTAAEKDWNLVGGRQTELVSRRGEVNKEIDRIDQQIREVARKLEKEGGGLFKRREAIVAELAAAESQAEAREDRLCDLAAGDAPLWLVPDLLHESRALASKSEDSVVAQRVLDILERRDAQIQALLGSGQAGAAIRRKVTRFMEADARERATNATNRMAIDLNTEGFAALNEESRDELLAVLQEALSTYQQSLELAAGLKLRIASIPEMEAIQKHLDDETKLQEERAQRRAMVSLIDEELAKLARELERAKRRLDAARSTLRGAKLGESDGHRIVMHARRAGETLVRFRCEVVAQNVRRMEGLIADRFKSLLRKGDHLISSIAIDPKDFGLKLRDRDNRAIEPLTLSAGERQLLAVAIVWALAKASGRALPTVIDTPLGRLDGDHRTNLVENYFPAASHQVILLSTDEEVNGRYYRQLRPFVAQEYLLSYDIRKRSSAFEEGYFEQTTRAVA